MSYLYQNSGLCVVLPGGLQRLPRLQWKETCTGYKRHWALQEAVLPPEVLVLFEWRLGLGCIDSEVDICAIQGSQDDELL